MESFLSKIIRSAIFNFFHANQGRIQVLARSSSRNPKPLDGVARESNEFEPSIIRAARRRESFPQIHGRSERYRAVTVCLIRLRASRAYKRTRSACTRKDCARGCSHCEINEFFTMDTLTVAGRVSKSVPDAL